MPRKTLNVIYQYSVNTSRIFGNSRTDGLLHSAVLSEGKLNGDTCIRNCSTLPSKLGFTVFGSDVICLTMLGS